MKRLSIIPNETEKSPEAQLEQVQTALRSIQTWSNSNKPQDITGATDSDTSDITTTSNSYVPIKSIKAEINLTSSLFLYTIKVLVNSTNLSYLAVTLDGEIIEEIPFDGKQVICFTGWSQGSNGRHILSLSWKTTAGTATKIAAKNGISLLTWSA